MPLTLCSDPERLIPLVLDAVARARGTWRYEHELARLGVGHPPGTVGRALWRAFEQGQLDVDALQPLWGLLAEAPDAVSATTLLRFVHENARRYPDGRRDPHPRFAGAQPVGALHLYSRVAQAQGDDPAFRRLLSLGQETLEPLWRPGLLWVMAQEEVLEAELITDPELETLARSYFVDYRPHLPWWGSPNPMPAERWSRALLAASADPQLSCVNPLVLLELLPHATPEQLVERMRRAASASSTWAAVLALDTLGAEHWPALERAALSLEVVPAPDHPWEAWPATLMVFTYIRLSQRLGQAPDLALGPVARAMLAEGGRLPVPGSALATLMALARLTA
ncbi:MAG: hypothetical protein H6741_13335 [Alphaproteobacteria bacterium]|nr:hypothetical protein [Alphaproteobacteria bacterium]MCB9793699.1 hypothetical protein [Alphaproteobacteria bacterium]